MPEFLFVFGYENPGERAANEAHGLDMEAAGFFRIVADSKEEAFEWGRQLAEWYVGSLFAGAAPTTGWKESGYASWIEETPDDELASAAANVEAVRVGEFPSLEETRSVFGD